MSLLAKWELTVGLRVGLRGDGFAVGDVGPFCRRLGKTRTLEKYSGMLRDRIWSDPGVGRGPPPAFGPWFLPRCGTGGFVRPANSQAACFGMTSRSIT